MSDILEILLRSGIDAREDEPLASHSSFKIGGRADIFLLPESEEELLLSVRTALERGVRFEVIGNASNILFSDKGYRGAIISTVRMKNISVCESADSTRISASCGVALPRLSALAADMGLSGLEFACGIPATLGGALCMNAGAHGGDMSDVTLSSRAYDSRSDKIISLDLKEHRFSYRHSVYSECPWLICLGAELSLGLGNKEEIEKKTRENNEKRRSTQPLSLASAGSFFKRPEGHFAARLIDECGLKGRRVGGAEVSEKHAGFIVNTGGATATDVLSLADIVSHTVLEKTGIKLEREVRYIGD